MRVLLAEAVPERHDVLDRLLLPDERAGTRPVLQREFEAAVKRTPLKRGNKPLARRSPMARKPRRARPGSDPKYLAWVRTLDCAACPFSCRDDRIHAHHTTFGRGIAQKTADRNAIPLCDRHHRARHSLTGWFKDWDRERIRHWEADAVAHYRALYERRGGG